MTAEQRLALVDLRWRGRQLAMRFDLAGHPLGVSTWYGDVDLEELERKIGRDLLERVTFAIAAFEINKLVPLGATLVDFGPWTRLVTPRLEELWRTVLSKVWAQWRWQNDRRSFIAPAIAGARAALRPIDRPAGLLGERTLLFVGGGKDSLVAATLLERAGVPWASHAYAHSAYGPPEPQHSLIDHLLDALEPAHRHRQWVSDDAFAAPLPELVDGGASNGFLAAETPSSIFAALPVVLAHEHRWVALAHEHSANRGNLVWAATGEEVNHQWGKSWEAERAISSYIEEELLPGFRWFSVLQPIGDVLVFELLRDAGEAVLRAHSCNVKKPWCLRCPKCAYVALGYAAHLDDGVYERVFADDVLDIPENEVHYRQMMGLGDHTPFECIGEIGEVRLALALCEARGRRTRAVDVFAREIGRVDVEALLARHVVVHDREPHGIPAEIAARVLPIMKSAETSAQARIRSLLR